MASIKVTSRVSGTCRISHFPASVPSYRRLLHNTEARDAEHSRPLFPSVHRLLLEHTVTNLEKIKGTGVRGMLTKGDVLTFLGKASNPLGTFKFGLSPIEEASKLVEKEKEVVLTPARTLDGASIRRLIVNSMLQNSNKARNPLPDHKAADFDSVISDYLPPSSKSLPKVMASPSPLPKKSLSFLDEIASVTCHLSIMSQLLESQPVLVASVHDVRYFAALLRGVNFVNRATVTVTQQGMTVTVEEARTLLGTAFIFSEVFDEYTYHAEPPRAARPQKPKPSETDPNASGTESDSENGENKEQSEELDNAAFEIPLNILIECLNIFGTAGAMNSVTAISRSSEGGGAPSNSKQAKKWRRVGDGDSDGEERAGGRGLETYFGPSAGEKRTGMRLSYLGAGYPLTLIIAEDAAGPTATCEITTFDPEPQLELHYDNDQTVLKIIFKSSWLRDALSELDPSCERLTFIGNPPVSIPHQQNATAGTSANENTDVKSRPIRHATMKPMLRIQATGTFGSTEMDYPNDRDVLETFECTQSVGFSYRFGHISRTLKALQHSFKTSLRIDRDGLLSLQFLMPKPGRGGRGDAFIEFRCLALDDEF